MDELAKKLQEKYIDDISARYPLHRFACLFLYLLASYIFYIKESSRFLGAFSGIKVNYLFDFSNGLLAQITLEQLLISIVLTFVVAAVCTKLKVSIFKILSRLSDFDGYVVRLKAQVEPSVPGNNAMIWSLSSDIAKQLDLKRHKLRSQHSLAELLFTFALCMGIGYRGFESFDWLVLALLAIAFLRVHWVAFKMYIAEFLPFYVAEQTLLGKEVSFESGADT